MDNSYQLAYNLGYITGQILVLGVFVLIIWGIIRFVKKVRK